MNPITFIGKINSYVYNESGERLQLFILNDEYYDISKNITEVQVSQKHIYDRQFDKVLSFIKKSYNKSILEIEFEFFHI